MADMLAVPCCTGPLSLGTAYHSAVPAAGHSFRWPRVGANLRSCVNPLTKATDDELDTLIAILSRLEASTV
jgi:hypothetical protein